MLPNNFINLDNLNILNDFTSDKPNHPETIEKLHLEVSDTFLMFFKAIEALSDRISKLEEKLK